MIQTSEVLHIPEGINYECTGCGKCCSGWTVPLTEADYQRVVPTNWGERLEKLKGRKLFRPLKDYEKKGTPYSYAMVEGDDGYCQFLVNNLCFIHSQFQAETKPSMCQLFPYCFNETPSGIYATVSFVSMAVVHNTGKGLVEQREYLEKKLGDFRALYPNHHPNWSKLELTGGHPFTWNQYLAIEQNLLGFLKMHDIPFEERFKKGSQYLLAQLKQEKQNQSQQYSDNATPEQVNSAPDGVGMVPEKVDAVTQPVRMVPQAVITKDATGETKLKPLDIHLLMAFHQIYFPTKILSRGESDFSFLRFFNQILFKGWQAPLTIAVPSDKFQLAQLAKIEWCGLEPDSESLIYRYFYSRIFGKLYFGAGFGQLSLITGFHHLAIIYALLKLQAKALAAARGVEKVSYLDLVTAIRQLEKRLGETAINGYAAAAFELLLFSPARLNRILTACR